MSANDVQVRSRGGMKSDRGQPEQTATSFFPKHAGSQRAASAPGGRKKILFCTIGQTPQVVTETVWALKNPKPPARPWTPDEIHVVTTTFALARIRQALQRPGGRLAELLGVRIPPVTIHVPRRNGSPLVLGPVRAEGDWSDGDTVNAGPLDEDALSDVNTELDAAIMGDLILQLMAGLMRDDATEVHVSLAGGRKTMSAHALLAMTLVARPRDRASHVLVSPAFEDNTEFWHPDQGGTIGPKRRPGAVAGDEPGERLDPNDAKVLLVPTPTPLMRYELKNEKALGALRLVEVVNQLNLTTILEDNPRLCLDIASNTVVVADVPLQLSAKLFALFRLIAIARKEDWPGVGPDGTGANHGGWLSCPHICTGRTGLGRAIDQVFLSFLIDAVSASPVDNDTQDNKSIKAWEAVLAKGAGRKQELAEKQLRPNLTNLRTELRRAFGHTAARILLPPNREGGARGRIPDAPLGSEDAPRFGLTLPAEAIEIV